jgi:hypothetical protein
MKIKQDPDPDPKLVGKSEPDPDPKKIVSDPQHCFSPYISVLKRNI